MGDNDLSAMKDRKLKLLSQKNDERKLNLEKRKEIKTKQLAEDENINKIVSQFDSLEADIQNCLKNIETGEVNENLLRDLFDQCFCQLKEWQNLISLTSHVTTIYHKKSFQEKYNNMNDKRVKLEQELIPREKFSFKRTEKKPSEMATNKSGSTDEPDVAAPETPRKFLFKFNDESEVSNLENESVMRNHEKMFQNDVVFRKLKNCRLSLEGGASTIHFVSLENCLVLCGPVSTSVFIEECKNCIFVVACQQLRTHRTFDCDFYLHVTSRPIIEDCQRVRFAPYNWRYEKIDQHFEAVQLPKTPNNWYLVHDFNWLSSAPSPNWSVIEEEKRDCSWH